MVGGCGSGGGSPAPPTVQAPIALRPGVVYCYYGAWDGQVQETAGHVNCVWSMGWGTRGAWLENMATQLTEAKQRGIPYAVIGLELLGIDPSETDLRYVFATLKAQGLLGEWIIAVYPEDEPDQHGRTDAQVTAAAARLRKVMAEFPELARTKLWVIFGPRGTPGIAAFDAIGRDDYDAACRVLAGGYDDLIAQMRPDQQLIGAPGGAFGQDPECFMRRAHSDPRFIALVPFIWFDNWDHNGQPGGKPGIRSNGMKQAYCTAGLQTLTGKNIACP